MSPAFTIDQSGNPELRRNELFPASEDLRDPRFAVLRERFAIDAALAGVAGEFARILALRHWLAGRIAIDNEHPTALPRLEAMSILAAAARGGRFHCEHFSLAQDAVLNAYGFVARRLGVGPGTAEDGRHHGVNEVWVNELGKWVVVDAKYDLHFELAGVPLSALEIRDQVLRDGGAAVRLVYGPERRAGPRRGHESPLFYRWVSWEPGTNRFSIAPCPAPASLIVFDDEAFRSGTWLRDGRPHWAYDAGFFIRTVHRAWIEWTPGVTACAATLDGSRLELCLTTCTPNLASFELSLDGAAWQPCHDSFAIELPAMGAGLAVRTVNLAGVAGPPHQLRVLPVAAAGKDGAA